MKVHPDLFGQYHHEQQVNDKSFQSLMGFLDSIKSSTEGYPPAEELELPFYIHKPKCEGEFLKVVLSMETNGGDCAFVIEDKLGKFLGELGLPAEFDWGIYTWGLISR
jgi:hypothetical protein